MPTTRTLSAQLGLNPMTISKAYSFLEVEGIVERRRGLPLTVKSLRPEEIQVQKLDRFRQSLTSIITIARQLGIDKSQALEIFSQMLDDAGDQEKEV